MVAVPGENPPLPAELLHAVAERMGRIALVVGAGCSMEAPTGLELATTYSLEVHRQLIEDGLLTEGECPSPEDLSLLTSTVWEKHSSQVPVVERLPRNKFRQAQPNGGYLVAAALLRERVVSAVLTLNFDIAMTAALGQLGAEEVTVVPGPAAAGQVGSAAVIYLHRNVDETDANKWILRREALEQEWRDQWEEVIAQRVMSSPVVVFVGLGSPAAVLTETVSRVRTAIQESHRVYVVDPAATTQFQAALNLPPDAHTRLGWGDFMELLANRLLAELRQALKLSCREMCSENGWDGEAEPSGALCERLHHLGLVDLGALRAVWLLERPTLYAPDDRRRNLIADLVLGVGLVERHHGAEAHFYRDGTVRLYRAGLGLGSFLAASGGGTLRWTALEARVLKLLQDYRGIDRPRGALLGGVPGGRPAAIAAPEDVVGDWGNDISQGGLRPPLLTVDEVRDDPAQSEQLVA